MTDDEADQVFDEIDRVEAEEARLSDRRIAVLTARVLGPPDPPPPPKPFGVIIQGFGPMADFGSSSPMVTVEFTAPPPESPTDAELERLGRRVWRAARRALAESDV